MTTGISAAGFQAKTLQEIFDEMESEILTNYDAELDTSEDAAIGQVLRIFSKKLAEGWELLDTAYSAFDESKAEGSLLEEVSALTGTYREPASKGLVTINCTLVVGTALTTAATVGHVTEDSNRWSLKTAFTAPTTGVHALTFECTREGSFDAVAGTLTVIKTPVAGWSSASNPSDAEPGAEIELIEDLRIRRREELRAQGGCTVPAQYADILTVDGVISARVFENDGYRWNDDGLPPKSFEVVIWDGVTPAASNADIWQCIYDNKPAGIESVGSVATTIADASGNEIDVAFSRTTQVPITVAITVARDVDLYPIDGDYQVKAAIVAYGDALRSGNDAIRKRVESAAMQIDGVVDISACTLNGVAANIAIDKRQIAVFDTSTITVTQVAAPV